MTRLILQVAAGVASLWLATKIVPGVEFVGDVQYLIFVGFILGLINFFIKPVLKLLTLPLRILTLGLFGIIINMALIWIVDVLFIELVIPGIISLFWTTMLVWIVTTILNFYSPKKKF